MRLRHEDLRDGEYGGGGHDQQSEEQFEFVHPPKMRRLDGNLDLQMPRLPCLPQRDGHSLNGAHFLRLDPGLDLFAFRPPALADLEAGDALLSTRLVPFVEPDGHGANPAHAVRGPKHSMKKGKTPVLAAEEARALLDSIETDRLIGLRDRALIGLMVYTFARVNAVLSMRVEDYFVQDRRGWVQLHEKGGKLHSLPCHHNLDTYLEAYISAAGIATDAKGPLFRTASNRAGDELTTNPLWQQDAYRMIQRRAKSAGIRTHIGNHSFRATGITAYLKNGGRLEIAQQMANHESSRTTGLYDRRGDEITLDEVERVGI